VRLPDNLPFLGAPRLGLTPVSVSYLGIVVDIERNWDLGMSAGRRRGKIQAAHGSDALALRVYLEATSMVFCSYIKVLGVEGLLQCYNRNMKGSSAEPNTGTTFV